MSRNRSVGGPPLVAILIAFNAAPGVSSVGFELEPVGKGVGKGVGGVGKGVGKRVGNAVVGASDGGSVIGVGSFVGTTSVPPDGVSTRPGKLTILSGLPSVGGTAMYWGNPGSPSAGPTEGVSEEMNCAAPGHATIFQGSGMIVVSKVPKQDPSAVWHV
jgi:hypothetical protein